MPKKNSSKNKSAPQGAAVLADKLKGVLSAGTSGQAAAQLLHLHDEFGGQNFQKLVTLGWASTDESTREGLDAALAACFENSGDPLQWRHPFTNIAVIVIKNIPLKYAANSAVVAWLRRNYRCLSLNTKALLFEQMLLDSAPLEGGAGGAAAAGPPLDAAGVVARKSLDSDTGDRVFYVRHMMSLIDEAESRQNFRAGMSVLVSGLSRCPPITTISVDRLNRLMYAAIQCDQSSHIGVRRHVLASMAHNGCCGFFCDFFLLLIVLWTASFVGVVTHPVASCHSWTITIRGFGERTAADRSGGTGQRIASKECNETLPEV